MRLLASKSTNTSFVLVHHMISRDRRYWSNVTIPPLVLWNGEAVCPQSTDRAAQDSRSCLALSSHTRIYNDGLCVDEICLGRSPSAHGFATSFRPFRPFPVVRTALTGLYGCITCHCKSVQIDSLLDSAKHSDMHCWIPGTRRKNRFACLGVQK